MPSIEKYFKEDYIFVNAPDYNMHKVSVCNRPVSVVRRSRQCVC